MSASREKNKRKEQPPGFRTDVRFSRMYKTTPFPADYAAREVVFYA